MCSAESRENSVCCAVTVITTPCPTTWPFPLNPPAERSVRQAEFYIHVHRQKTHALPRAERAGPNMPCVPSPSHQKERRPYRNLGQRDLQIIPQLQAKQCSPQGQALHPVQGILPPCIIPIPSPSLLHPDFILSTRQPTV